MITEYALLSRHEGNPLIPLEIVLKEYLGGMSRKMYDDNVREGKLELVAFRPSNSQKAKPMIHISDLAKHLDKQRREAIERFSLPR